MSRPFWKPGAPTEKPMQVPTGQPAFSVGGSHPVAGESMAAPANANISIPSEAEHSRGKLRVRIVGARGLAIANKHSNPYVVCLCASSEHISQSVPVDTGAIAIPTKRAIGLNRDKHSLTSARNVGNSDPSWEDETLFDLAPRQTDATVELTIYDAGNDDAFLGTCHIKADFSHQVDKWYPLHSRQRSSERVSGEVRVVVGFEKGSKRQYGPQDFEVMRLIGKGTFGQVYQVRKKDSRRVYAMKVLSKRTIVQKKEITHTIAERDILVRTSSSSSPFLLSLKFAFQTTSDLYLVTDYMSGGELFWHLQREGRFEEPRAKFYIAEILLALEHLHDNDIVYRDLKPENILLDATGHIALCDFGLSKANLSNNGTTNTFCGTTEYLAPEVLLDEKGYTKMVDFWSLGVLIFEMCCGWSPFYAEDGQQMYKNIAFGKVRFPKDALSPEGRDFVKGLLNRNPRHRLGCKGDARELMSHPFFNDIDWDLLIKKQIPPPYKPHLTSEEDTSNFDPEFTQASTSVFLRGHQGMASTPLSPGVQAKFKGFTFVDDTLEDHYNSKRAGQSVRPQQVLKDDGIDLYDDNDIKMSESFYTSGIKSKFAMAHDDEEMRMSDVDEMEERDPRRIDDEDFVTAQGFEI